MKKKQIVSLLLVAVLSIGLLAGCGSKTSSDSASSNTASETYLEENGFIWTKQQLFDNEESGIKTSTDGKTYTLIQDLDEDEFFCGIDLFGGEVSGQDRILLKDIYKDTGDEVDKFIKKLKDYYTFLDKQNKAHGDEEFSSWVNFTFTNGHAVSLAYNDSPDDPTKWYMIFGNNVYSSWGYFAREITCHIDVTDDALYVTPYDTPYYYMEKSDGRTLDGTSELPYTMYTETTRVLVCNDTLFIKVRDGSAYDEETAKEEAVMIENYIYEKNPDLKGEGKGKIRDVYVQLAADQTNWFYNVYMMYGADSAIEARGFLIGPEGAMFQMHE